MEVACSDGVWSMLRTNSSHPGLAVIAEADLVFNHFSIFPSSIRSCGRPFFLSGVVIPPGENGQVKRRNTKSIPLCVRLGSHCFCHIITRPAPGCWLPTQNAIQSQFRNFNILMFYAEPSNPSTPPLYCNPLSQRSLDSSRI